jgi:hypothetical protein
MKSIYKNDKQSKTIDHKVTFNCDGPLNDFKI